MRRWFDQTPIKGVLKYARMLGEFGPGNASKATKAGYRPQGVGRSGTGALQSTPSQVGRSHTAVGPTYAGGRGRSRPGESHGRNSGFHTLDTTYGHLTRFDLDHRLDKPIRAAAKRHGVDPALIKSVLFEEMTHQVPPAGLEWLAERAGLGDTVGLGQVTVGLNGYTRKQLLDPETNIDAVAKHLGNLQQQAPIDPARPAASLATRYNCGSCKSVTKYGRRVEHYRRQFEPKR